MPLLPQPPTIRVPPTNEDNAMPDTTPTISPTDYPYPGLPGHYLWREEWEGVPIMVQVRVQLHDDGTYGHTVYSVARGQGDALAEPWSQGFWTMVYTTPDDLQAIVNQVLGSKKQLEIIEHARDALEAEHEALQNKYDQLVALYDAAVLDTGKLASRLGKERSAFTGSAD